MINLKQIQKQQGEWQNKNFPYDTNTTKLMCALGVSEEAGELAHAVLKHVQSIRGMGDIEAARAKVKDAIGDIAIYAMGVCNQFDLNIEDCIQDTWCEVVLKREWKTNEAGRMI